MTQTQTTTRRNLFCIGAAAAVTATAPSVLAAVGRGDDNELLAMIARAEVLWDRFNELNEQHIKLIRALMPPGPRSNDEWEKASEDPRAVAFGREVEALETAGEALDKSIRNFKPRTLEGAVAQADFLHGDEDFREIVLANLRRIVEGRA